MINWRTFRYWYIHVKCHLQFMLGIDSNQNDWKKFSFFLSGHFTFYRYIAVSKRLAEIPIIWDVMLALAEVYPCLWYCCPLLKVSAKFPVFSKPFGIIFELHWNMRFLHKISNSFSVSRLSGISEVYNISDEQTMANSGIFGRID